MTFHARSVGRATVRFALLVLVLMGGLSAEARAQVAPDTATALIRQLGDETLAILDDTATPQSDQIADMRAVFRRYFAVPSIGQFVLSRHWRRATPEQRAEYLRLFEDLIVYGYAQRFGGYAGERLEITGARPSPGGATTVQSRVVSPDRARSVAVNWQVEMVDGQPQITDVVVEGVSLKLTQRSDFSAAIKQQGGDVGRLIALLRDKTQTLKNELES